MTLPSGQIHPKSVYVLGIDPARTGRDSTAFVVLEQLWPGEDIFVVYMEDIHTPDLKTVIGKAIYLDSIFNFKQVVVDTTGIGAGVTDVLKGKLGNKVKEVWYTSRSKAEIFNNVKILMSKPEGGLHIPNYLTNTDPVVRKMYFQFLSITEDYSDDTGTRLPKISHKPNKHDDLINAICLGATYWKVEGNKKKKYNILGFNFT